ncbi:MAG: GDP-mannose mannosyl hydrolase [Bacteroidales bacterium]|nr:GDP-mannose mannosyl hydrolase [Bacteroidales bacterium]
MQRLSESEFRDVVKNTPLVSIDLIIENADGEILLGWRNNHPAKGYWFVPGGRIQKGEQFKDAFRRIVKAETGITFQLKDSDFLGIYEHIYPNENYRGDSSFGTHYIVIAYRIKVKDIPENIPDEQHQEYWWATIDEILEDSNVHQNTKNYFNGLQSFSE